MEENKRKENMKDIPRVITAGTFEFMKTQFNDSPLMMARAKFVEEYCAERKWVVDNITMDQLIEIRAQPKWKNPLGEEGSA